MDGTNFANDVEKSAYVSRILEQYSAELRKELRKETMISLERAMKDAAQKGDKERERQIREEFSALLMQP